MELRIGFIWLRIGLTRASCEHANKRSGIYKLLGNSWLTKRLLDSQE
jgi:hypothetical protein